MDAIETSNINIYFGYDIIDVMMSPQRQLDGVLIREVISEMQTGIGEDSKLVDQENGIIRTLACSSLLCCLKKTCDFDTFAAINDAGLVYDGGVVVDKASYFSIINELMHMLGKNIPVYIQCLIDIVDFYIH